MCRFDGSIPQHARSDAPVPGAFAQRVGTPAGSHCPGTVALAGAAMTEAAKTPTLSPELSAVFAEFARACKAAARAVALYPGSHPAIGASLGRLAETSGRL